MTNFFSVFFPPHKKINYNWHLFGLIPFLFGMLDYVFDIVYHVGPWEFLWACPVAAILSGLIIISKSRFGISASIVWLAIGPLSYVLFYPDFSFRLWHIHHVVSVLTLFVILYNLKKIFNLKGFLFGLTSFCSYMIITSYLSAGKINMLANWWEIDGRTLFLGVFFAIISVAIFMWHYFEKNR